MTVNVTIKKLMTKRTIISNGNECLISHNNLVYFCRILRLNHLNVTEIFVNQKLINKSHFLFLFFNLTF